MFVVGLRSERELTEESIESWDRGLEADDDELVFEWLPVSSREPLRMLFTTSCDIPEFFLLSTFRGFEVGAGRRLDEADVIVVVLPNTFEFLFPAVTRG